MIPRAERARLIGAICTAYETTEGALASAERKTAGTARARAALYALTKAVTGASYVSIARWIGCHHATVMHALERHEQRMAVADGREAPVRIWWNRKIHTGMPNDLREPELCRDYAARFRLAAAIVGRD